MIPYNLGLTRRDFRRVSPLKVYIGYWSIWFNTKIDENDLETKSMLADLYAAIANDVKIGVEHGTILFKLLTEYGIPNTSNLWNYVVLIENGREIKIKENSK